MEYFIIKLYAIVYLNNLLTSMYLTYLFYLLKIKLNLKKKIDDLLINKYLLKINIYKSYLFFFTLC